MTVATKQRIRVSLGWLALDRGGRIVLNLCVLGVVARHLGPELFGRLNYAASIAALFAIVASCGLEGVIIRELLARPGETPVLLGTATGLRCLGGVFAMMLAGLVGWTHGGDGELMGLALLVAAGFLPQALEITDLWFQKEMQSQRTALARGGAAVVGAGIKLGLVAANAPLAWFAAALGFVLALAAVALAWLWCWGGGQPKEWRFCRHTARRLLAEAMPLVGAGLLVAVYLRVEQVIVREFLGDAAAGVYFAAARLAEQWVAVPGLVITAVYPVLAQRSTEAAGQELRMQRLFDALTLLGLLLATGVTLLGPWLIPLLFGVKFQAAVPVLIVLAWSAPVIFNGAARAQWLLLAGLTLYHIPSALLGISVNVAVGLWAVPRFGPVGAAAGALVGYAASAVLTSWLFPPLRPCARLQMRAFLLPFEPHRIRKLIRLIRES